MEKLILLSPKEYFSSLIEEAVEKQKLKSPPIVREYLVNLLNFYLDARNFHEEATEGGKPAPTTLAELYLTAQSEDHFKRQEILKRLGDRSLYVSGFFTDSLNRKLVDVDYYADIGGVAYAELASSAKEDAAIHVYRLFSKRFLEFADVLSYVSQKSNLTSNENVLRLYERYIKTGSEWAREMLLEAGVVTLPQAELKKSKQEA